MTGQQLKNSILQWAIQGKLVPQIASEGTAEDLLKEIRAEKEKLVKEGKLKKKDLEVKPIEDDEIPFEIPEGWRWCRLNEIVNYETNLVSPNKYLSYNHIAPDNIQKGTGKLLEYRSVKEDNVKSNNHLFYKDQILYSKIRPLLRKAIIAPFDGLCSADMYPLHSFVEKKYVLILLLSDFLNYQIADICASRVKMPKINQEEMSHLFVPLPPLSEQKRIVSKIEELMPLVEQYGKAQEQLEALNKELPETLKKSVLQEAIMGKLVPQDPKEGTADELLAEIRKEKEKLVKEGKLKKKDLEVKPIEEDEVPFEIPEGWRWCRLGEMITLLSGQDLTPDKYFDTPKGIPYITGASHFINGELTISRWTESPTSISHIGDLLITCKGTVGTMAYNKIGEVHIARQIMAINGYKIYLPYIQHFLEIEVPELEKKAHSIIPGISREVVLNTIIPLPPLAEQKRIVAKIEEVMGEIEGMKR